MEGGRPLFRYNRWAGRFWFNSALRASDELKAQYRFAGWLLGQSMHNRAALGAAFPALLFSKLLLGSSFKVGSRTTCGFHNPRLTRASLSD